MKFVINGDEYEGASLERVTGTLALDLPKQAGIGLQQLARLLEETARLAFDDDGGVVVLSAEVAQTPEGAARINGRAILDSEPHLRALLAFLWVSRRLDGEKTLTFAAACEFPILDLDVVPDDEPEDVEPDPTQPGSDPVDTVAASR